MFSEEGSDAAAAANQQQPSLISNLHGMSTPPHDFSKKLSMTKITGKQLYPPNTVQGVQTWTPPMHSCAPDEGCLEYCKILILQM